jgi:hypothetical protein
VLFCNPDISIASRVQTVLALAEPSKSFRMRQLGKRFPFNPPLVGYPSDPQNIPE